MAEVGIHPSYASDSEEEAVREERDRLETILRRPVAHSRQHYLAVEDARNVQDIGKLGIENDHSMGYAEEAGYRASIAVPYPFYDLEYESILPLTIHPFVYMDTTYAMYKELDAQEAEPPSCRHEELKSVGGHFRVIWHNRTFGEHEPGSDGWVQLFKQLLDAAPLSS